MPNALAIGYDDHVHGSLGPVCQNIAHPAPIVCRDVETTWPPKDLAKTQACLADRWRVDDRHQLRDMCRDQPVEQRLVPVLKADQVDVSVQVVGFGPNLIGHTLELLIDIEHTGRQQTAQAQ
jgi:hypothetical protein